MTLSWRTAACQPPGVNQDFRSDGRSDGGRTVAMVTARARVPAMACVGGPAAGRRARVGGAICGVAPPAGSLSHRSLFGRWKNLGCRRSNFEGAKRAPKFGASLSRKLAPPAKRGCGKYGRTRALFLRWRLISEGLPLLRCSNGREREGEELSIATAVHASRDVRPVWLRTLGFYRR